MATADGAEASRPLPWRRAVPSGRRVETPPATFTEFFLPSFAIHVDDCVPLAAGSSDEIPQG